MYMHVDICIDIYTNIYTNVSTGKRNNYFLLLGVCIGKGILMCVCYFLYYCPRSYHSNHHFQDKRLNDLYFMEIHLSALIRSPLGSDHRTSSQKPESKEIQSASKECWETVLNQPSILSYLHGIVLASEMHSDVVWTTYKVVPSWTEIYHGQFINAHKFLTKGLSESLTADQETLPLPRA